MCVEQLICAEQPALTRHEVWYGQTSCMASIQDVAVAVHTWPTGQSTNTWAPRLTCNGVASADLGDRRQPTDPGMVPNMFV